MVKAVIVSSDLKFVAVRSPLIDVKEVGEKEAGEK